MTFRSTLAGVAVMACAVLLTLANPLFAQSDSADATAWSPSPGALITDLSRTEASGENLQICIWMPYLYWEVSLAAYPMSETMRSEALGILRQYTIIAIVDGSRSALGMTSFKAEIDTRGRLSISRDGENWLGPLEEDMIDPGVATMLQMIRPMLAANMGNLGENMHLYVWKDLAPDGGQIYDPTKPGRLYVRLGETAFDFRLPLDSAVPPTECSKCGETCSGAWQFCPYCGGPLKPSEE